MAAVESALPSFALTSSTMRIASSFATLFLFLHIGHVMRERLALLRRAMLPASLLGGILALIVVQLCGLNASVDAVIRNDFIVGWSKLPGFLINIVFATLFLGAKIPSVREIFDTAAPQICYGWVLAFGNWAVACLLTGAVFTRIWGVNKLFSTLGPVGFTGGHGTAGGLRETYAQLGFDTGGDLALTSATIGILLGLLVGTVIVNVANSLGWTYKSYVEREESISSLENGSVQAEVDITETNEERDGSTEEKKTNDISKRIWKRKAIIPTDERVSGGMLTVSGDAVETLALQLCYVALAIYLAYWTKRMLMAIETTNAWLTQYAFFSGFPLFPLALLYGLVIQLVLNKFCKDSPLDRGMMERIGGVALDVLVLSAVATTNVSAVATQIVPLVLLCLSLLLFQVLCFFLLAPRMLPDFWTERACAEFGVATATTSIGLMLLRSIDGEFKTPAAKAFAAKQLFTEPLLGGGVITSLMLPLIASLGNFAVFGISISVVLIVLVIWYFVLSHQKIGPMTQYKFVLENNKLL